MGRRAVFPGSLFISFLFRVPFGKCGYLLYFTLILYVIAIYEMPTLLCHFGFLRFEPTLFENSAPPAVNHEYTACRLLFKSIQHCEGSGNIH